MARNADKHFWYCNVCNAQNSREDGECQFCDCGALDGGVCKRDNCSTPEHFHADHVAENAPHGRCSLCHLADPAPAAHPTPWRHDSTAEWVEETAEWQVTLRDANKVAIGAVSSTNGHGDALTIAARIVAAVNTADDFTVIRTMRESINEKSAHLARCVAALETCVAALATIGNLGDPSELRGEHLAPAYNAARAALAAVEE